MHKHRPIIAALSAPLTASDAPVNLIPDGLFRAVDGRPAGIDGWRMSPEIADALLSRVQSRRTRLAINYEHPEATGQPMPAAGWIDRSQMRYEPGVGIVALVEWTARAKAHIDAGEYAYLSPVISYDPKTGAVRDLYLAGLTNTPALDSLAPLAKLAETLGLDLPLHEEDQMNLAALRQSLALADDADEQAILAAVAALKAESEKVISLTEQVTALTAKQAPDMSQYVPKAVHDEAMAALRKVSAEGAQAELAQLIEQGLASGKIPGQATAAWLKEKGLDFAKAHLADAPAVPALTQTQTQGRQTGERKTALTAEQQQVCKLMGVSEADYIKTLEAAQ